MQSTHGNDESQKSGTESPENSGDNLALWNRLKRTNPKATKPYRGATFSGTQIDPYWRYLMMTDTFGPCGKGWGYEITDPIITDGMMFIGAKVWYSNPENGEKYWSGMQYGGDTLFKTRKDGTKTPNDECAKMAVTDAVGKALSLLGLGADVYTGQFDDSKYREESEVIYTVKSNPDLRPPAIEKFEADLKEKLAAVADLESLDDLWRDGVNARIREIGAVDKAAQNRMISAFSQKKNEILKREESDQQAAS
jgi:hypothetical protein